MDITTALQNAILTDIANAYDGGSAAATLELRSGAPPAHTSTADSGTLVATFTLGDPSFGTAASGAATANAIASATVAANGTVGHFRVKTSAGTCISQGTATAKGGGGNLEMETLALVAGQRVDVDLLKMLVYQPTPSTTTFDHYIDIAVANPTNPSTILTNFPLPLTFTLPTASTLANGDDIRVTTTADVAIPYGLKTITTSGANRTYNVICKVTIPAGTGTVLTVRVWYGNPYVANAEDRDGVSDSYARLHMPLGGSGTLDITDWTGVHTATNHGATLDTGPFGSAAVFDGDSHYMSVAHADTLNPHTSDWTVSAAVKCIAAVPGIYTSGSIYGAPIVNKSSYPDAEYSATMMLDGGTAAGNAYGAYIEDGDGVGKGAMGSTNLVGDWHWLMGVRVGDVWKVYVDGVLEGTDNRNIGGAHGADFSSTVEMQIGGQTRWSSPVYSNALISDLRLDAVERGLAWAQALYSYGKDAAQLTAGAEQSAAAAAEVLGVQLSGTTRSACCQDVADAVDAGSGHGTRKFYTGPKPTTIDTEETGTLLATVTLGDPAYATASDGEAVANASTPGTAVETGTIGHFGDYDSDDVVVANGTCTLAIDLTDFVHSTDTTGTGTLTAGHGRKTGDLVKVVWDGGYRYDVEVTISTNAVTFSGGAGYAFPASATTGMIVGTGDLLLSSLETESGVTSVSFGDTFLVQPGE